MLMRIKFQITSSLRLQCQCRWPQILKLKYNHPPRAPTQDLTAFYCVRQTLSLLLSTYIPQHIRFTFASPMVRLLNPLASPQLRFLQRISRSLPTFLPTTPSVNLFSAYLILLIWITMQRFEKMVYTYIMALTLFITLPSPLRKHLGLYLYNALLRMLMLLSLCLPTRNLCISCMLPWAARLLQQFSAHSVKVTCLPYLDSLPLCSANTDPTLKLLQWAISIVRGKALTLRQRHRLLLPLRILSSPQTPMKMTLQS